MADDMLDDFEASAKVPLKRGPRQAAFAKNAAQTAPKEPRMPQVGQLRTLQNEKVDGQKWDLLIYGSENSKDQYVDLAVNGHNIRVKRGEWVRVDEAYIEVLRNAVIQTYDQDPNTGLKTPVERLAYPFNAKPVPVAA